MNFARFFRTPISYNICERLFLVLVRIGLVWQAANLSIFCVIDCKSSQYLTYWNAVFNWFYTNARQVITEVCLDIQTPARGNTGIYSVWLISFKRCIRAWYSSDFSAFVIAILYTVTEVKDQNSFYEICSLGLCIFNWKQLNILKTFLQYQENYIVAYWRLVKPKFP